MVKKDIKYASLFANNTDIDLEERTRVVRELEKIGSLTFKIKKNKDGWTAQCKEVSGIITGNTNPNPTSTEIESQVRDAIYSAFNVKISKKSTVTEYQNFRYSFNG